jgi:hypothetical protein
MGKLFRSRRTNLDNQKINMVSASCLGVNYPLPDSQHCLGANLRANLEEENRLETHPSTVPEIRYAIVGKVKKLNSVYYIYQLLPYTDCCKFMHVS